METKPTIKDVRKYWDTHPLFSHEIGDVGSKSWFDAIDHIKMTDVEKFNHRWWNFESHAGQTVLDVGCGPGWYAVNYAKHGATTFALDLTPTGARLTRDHAQFRNSVVRTLSASAEQIPFAENTFDAVISSGVLHHTPDTPQAIRECARVLKPGGTARFALYHVGILHHPLLFPFVRFAANKLGAAHPAMDDIGDVRDFIRQYDGAGNPVGIAYSTEDWKMLCEESGFEVVGTHLYFFPKRFMPLANLIPTWLHRVIDRRFGTMICLELTKKSVD